MGKKQQLLVDVGYKWNLNYFMYLLCVGAVWGETSNTCFTWSGVKNSEG